MQLESNILTKQVTKLPHEKSPLAPLYQRGGLFLPLEKGGKEGFCKYVISIMRLMLSVPCHPAVRRKRPVAQTYFLSLSCPKVSIGHP
ncbi:MAG: hypothetical protein A2022_03980 [Deltaproteobacteria bacterium GWF2_42_12]|nr:MAG: hypothetical protein A2022_03980 [Deltaproteobacteria bacterium GWF2_42_12]OGQ67841.1 MAG: hypothetical protein A3F88_03915 [Deltaproteobacteria bacterium RIFCSPLOWO2_12_FULL_42_16]